MSVINYSDNKIEINVNNTHTPVQCLLFDYLYKTINIMDEVSEDLLYIFIKSISIDDIFIDYPNYSIDRTNQNDLKHYLLSINPNITWEIIQSNSRPNGNCITWDYNMLSRNPNITWDIVKSNPYPNGENSSNTWNYDILSENPNITWDIVKENLDKEWDYFSLSLNSNITWNIVKENPYPNGEHSSKRWNYTALSGNPNITWDIVQSNPEKEWDYSLLSENPNITWDIVKENPDKEPDYENDKISEKEWDYSILSKNPNITWDIVIANPNKDWNYKRLLMEKRFFDIIDIANIEKIKNIISHFKNNITEELMIYVWNPIRFEKWKYLVDEEEKLF